MGGDAHSEACDEAVWVGVEVVEESEGEEGRGEEAAEEDGQDEGQGEGEEQDPSCGPSSFSAHSTAS